MEKLPFLRHNAAPSKQMKIQNTVHNDYAKLNVAVVNPQDFPEDTFIICENKYVFLAKTNTKVLPGSIGLSGFQRYWCSWSSDQVISVSTYDYGSISKKNSGGGSYIGSMNIEIKFYNAAKAVSKEIDPDELEAMFLQKFENYVFQPTQILLFEFNGLYFELNIQSFQLINLVDIDSSNIPNTSNLMSKGIVVKQTKLNFFKDPSGTVNLKSSSKRPNADAIIRPDFKFEDMGIGGLDTEFTAIFRRAFASRIFPPGLIEKLGIQHVKGMLLYGPPGTGKTLIARQIGKMLNAKEPKIVNGPEILSKYVGSSEENIRNLFKDAEAEYKAKGDASSLHIIIFDELDSVFKQRGSRGGDSTGVADNVVNQLLAKMDGVDQLNNILVIGMTNRRDLIDDALLRPGRFEVQVEIHLPDEPGRLQILEIKVKKMKENGSLGKDVDLKQLAKLTKNFSGAEIEGLIKSATSFALNQHIKVGTVGEITGDLENTIVGMHCFINALNEVKPAFGVHTEDLEECIKGGIIKYSATIDNIITRGERAILQAQESEKFNFSSILLYGNSGSGKTALAAFMGLNSKFPFIRMIAADEMIGMSESAKVQFIDNTFRDAYKSPLNVLIVDNIEALIDYVPIGPRFSSTVLSALMVRLKKSPPEGHRLIVISTTSNYSLIKNLDMLGCFNDEVVVPNVSKLNELQKVMEDSEFEDDQGRKYVIDNLLRQFPDGRINVPIKKTLFNIDTAKFGRSPADDLVQLMMESST